jgi:ligand-binding sensor domain-containing protein
MLLTCASWATARAHYRFDPYDTSKGMPQNSVTGLTLSHDGYLWLTTNDGLARFDGVRFSVFNKGTGTVSRQLNVYQYLIRSNKISAKCLTGDLLSSYAVSS